MCINSIPSSLRGAGFAPCVAHVRKDLLDNRIDVIILLFCRVFLGCAPTNTFFAMNTSLCTRNRVFGKNSVSLQKLGFYVCTFSTCPVSIDRLAAKASLGGLQKDVNHKSAGQSHAATATFGIRQLRNMMSKPFGHNLLLLRLYFQRHAQLQENSRILPFSKL